ncbi:hypothetical protein J31TS4_24180 [Paenibacillus sp. J31TS4]|uniref:restriction endonuclease subunit S n=1 Tax=Paenibacillus sp. J31TS4 TaxID=2807195 RepID=UPI001B059699|nr:restriction endonuclease subunit S [Paenibacillus sp. J31TS4]GIP39138.1 hypothetical protein J31TS4_24180 [Paenibacillus sp. J31TS4]
MNRKDEMLRILEAAVSIQKQVAGILEAKVVEADKSQSWILRHIRPEAFDSSETFHRRSIEIHESIIETIDGLTKMEQGLARNLKELLDRGEPEQGGGFGDMFGGGGD